jgi:hypothetical protein
MARKRKRSTGARSRQTARKTAKKKARPAAKPKAKRRAKALVKAPKPKRAKTPPKARIKKHEPRVKFVRRKREADHELQVQSLIARVYRKAAEEMREMEQQSVNAKIELMRNAAAEMQALASKFEKT